MPTDNTCFPTQCTFVCMWLLPQPPGADVHTMHCTLLYGLIVKLLSLVETCCTLIAYLNCVHLILEKVFSLYRMPNLRILLINTKVPRSTKVLVEGVRKKYDKVCLEVHCVLECGYTELL